MFDKFYTFLQWCQTIFIMTFLMNIKNKPKYKKKQYSLNVLFRRISFYTDLNNYYVWANNLKQNGFPHAMCLK